MLLISKSILAVDDSDDATDSGTGVLRLELSSDERDIDEHSDGQSVRICEEMALYNDGHWIRS